MQQRLASRREIVQPVRPLSVHLLEHISCLNPEDMQNRQRHRRRCRCRRRTGSGIFVAILFRRDRRRRAGAVVVLPAIMSVANRSVLGPRAAQQAAIGRVLRQHRCARGGRSLHRPGGNSTYGAAAVLLGATTTTSTASNGADPAAARRPEQYVPRLVVTPAGSADDALEQPRAPRGDALRCVALLEAVVQLPEVVQGKVQQEPMHHEAHDFVRRRRCARPLSPPRRQTSSPALPCCEAAGGCDCGGREYACDVRLQSLPLAVWRERKCGHHQRLSWHHRHPRHAVMSATGRVQCHTPEEDSLQFSLRIQPIIGLSSCQLLCCCC